MAEKCPICGVPMKMVPAKAVGLLSGKLMIQELMSMILSDANTCIAARRHTAMNFLCLLIFTFGARGALKEI